MNSELYVDLATAYRPKTFAEVVGQKVPVTVLKNIANAKGVAVRAIFIKGSWGSGKTTLSKIFGRALNCERFKKLGDVCNECDACLDSFTKNTQNYYEFDSSMVGNVESIRGLIDLLGIAPKGRRAVVMDEIHAASTSSLNMLLKTVEEGIKDTIFVFCSTESILSTLQSRSIPLDVTTIPTTLIIERLRFVSGERGIQISDDSLEIIALKSAGHMRDALSILQLYELCGDDALNSSYKSIFNFINLCIARNPKAKDKDTIRELLTYNIVDLKNSIYSLIKNIYVATPNSKYYEMHKSGIHIAMFSFFFTPLVQQAIKDEVGFEITIHAFLSKIFK